MGPRGRRLSRKRGNETSEPRQAALEQRRTTAQGRRSARQAEAADVRRTAQQRVPEVQDLTSEGEKPRNQRNVAWQRRPQRESLTRRCVAEQRRGGNRVRDQSAARARAMVVCLDGASSSENEEEECQQTQKKRVKKVPLQEENKEDLHITLSPDKMSRGIMSDSSDSGDGLLPLTATPSSRTPVVRRPLNSFNVSPSGSSEDDIFGLDYSVCNTHALQEAFKEIKSSEASRKMPLRTVNHSSRRRPTCTTDSDDVCVIEESVANARKRQCSGDSPGSPPSSPILFDLDGAVQSEDLNQSARKKRWRRRRRGNKSTVKSKSLLEEFSRKDRMNDALDISSDVIYSEGEEDVNPEIRVLIKWGSESFRLPIRKWQKFSHLYETLGKKYEVSADRIVLNLKDKIVNPAHCPGDLKLTIADWIDGGIQSLQSNGESHQAAGAGRTEVVAATKDPNSILLRVQSSEKKGSVSISLGLNEKMSVLMYKYAEEKQLILDKLQFCFDGEVLSSHSTPKSLDMEGGECIDVYMLM